MKGRVLVLGAAGRLGTVAAETFRDAGWQVKGLVRPGRSAAVPRRVEAIEAVTRDEAVAAAQGCDVVLNAFNPVITEWQKNALSLAHAAIAAAESNGATLLFPGSVWNYGRGMPPVLDESTPMQPTARKGGMRVEIEQRIREACDRGMRAIVLRAGDFFGGGSGSWFDLVIAKDIGRGRLTYPGPLSVERRPVDGSLLNWTAGFVNDSMNPAGPRTDSGLASMTMRVRSGPMWTRASIVSPHFSDRSVLTPPPTTTTKPTGRSKRIVVVSVSEIGTSPAITKR